MDLAAQYALPLIGGYKDYMQGMTTEKGIFRIGMGALGVSVYRRFDSIASGLLELFKSNPTKQDEFRRYAKEFFDKWKKHRDRAVKLTRQLNIDIKRAGAIITKLQQSSLPPPAERTRLRLELKERLKKIEKNQTKRDKVLESAEKNWSKILHVWTSFMSIQERIVFDDYATRIQLPSWDAEYAHLTDEENVYVADALEGFLENNIDAMMDPVTGKFSMDRTYQLGKELTPPAFDSDAPTHLLDTAQRRMVEQAYLHRPRNFKVGDRVTDQTFVNHVAKALDEADTMVQKVKFEVEADWAGALLQLRLFWESFKPQIVKLPEEVIDVHLDLLADGVCSIQDEAVHIKATQEDVKRAKIQLVSEWAYYVLTLKVVLAMATASASAFIKNRALIVWEQEIKNNATDVEEMLIMPGLIDEMGMVTPSMEESLMIDDYQPVNTPLPRVNSSILRDYQPLSGLYTRPSAQMREVLVTLLALALCRGPQYAVSSL